MGKVQVLHEPPPFESCVGLKLSSSGSLLLLAESSISNGFTLVQVSIKHQSLVQMQRAETQFYPRLQATMM